MQTTDLLSLLDEEVIQKALAILERRTKLVGDVLNNGADVSRFLTLKLGKLEHEVFGLICLNSKNQVIAIEILFRGSLNQSSVYPREVIKEALRHNAASVILFHNHPSGSSEPSAADKELTERLANALKIVDINVADHLIVAGIKTFSFSENRIMPICELKV